MQIHGLISQASMPNERGKSTAGSRIVLRLKQYNQERWVHRKLPRWLTREVKLVKHIGPLWSEGGQHRPFLRNWSATEKLDLKSPPGVNCVLPISQKARRFWGPRAL